MFRFSIPLLLTLSACAPMTPDPKAAPGEVAGDATSSDRAEVSTPGARDPAAVGADGEPGVVEGSAGSGEIQPVPEDQIRVGPGLGEDSCKADAAQGLVGRSASEAVVKDAVRLSGAKAVRVIPHDGMVTMDYRGDRLNIQLDEHEKIVAITCG